MKLSAAYLLEELKKRYPIQTPDAPSLVPNLGRPVFCTESTLFKDKQIFITADPSWVPTTESDSLFFVTGQESAHFPAARSFVCLPESSVSKERLFNDIQEIFDRA